MLDYSKIESTKAEPEASSMIETFRAIGYSIETAIADIIDNSISAGANNIWVDYKWAGPDTLISITDDGCGMDNEELIQAMRPGSRHPLDERGPSDLGRFGLGLKTASFSQCRKFCVISRKNGYAPVYWTWDLDFVGQSKTWRLLRYKPDDLELYKKVIDEGLGTSVVWWEIDRLTKGTSNDNEKSKGKFLEIMESVKNHLGMVFHRFIEDGLNIYFRDRKISSWDPFMIGSSGIQSRPETILADGQIAIQGFVLPHRSKLSSEEYANGKGPKDSWTNHQGFYIYRNKRLLVAGDWLGLFKTETHYDLCRIKVDITNKLDSEWQIDIKKSQAKPPVQYREQIRALAKDVRSLAVEVYRHRGKIIKRSLAKNEYSPLWEERTRHGKRFYKLNRNHPIIETLLNKQDNTKKDIEDALQFIEETVPVPLIMVRENENETPHGQPFEGISNEPILRVMEAMYKKLIQDGLGSEEAKARVANIEPFDSHLEYFENINHE